MAWSDRSIGASCPDPIGGAAEAPGERRRREAHEALTCGWTWSAAASIWEQIAAAMESLRGSGQVAERGWSDPKIEGERVEKKLDAQKNRLGVYIYSR